jgi:hypothetical protein
MDRYSKAELTTLVAMLADNRPIDEIAQAINRSEGSVRVKASRIKCRTGRNLRPGRPNVIKAKLHAPTYDAVRMLRSRT